MRSRACHRLISPEGESLLALPKSDQKASPYCPPDPEVARKNGAARNSLRAKNEPLHPFFLPRFGAGEKGRSSQSLTYDF